MEEERELPLRVINGKENRVCKIICTIFSSLAVLVVVILVVLTLLVRNHIVNLMESSQEGEGNLVANSEYCKQLSKLPETRNYNPPHVYQSGWDKEGRPVWIMDVGTFDYAKTAEENQTMVALLSEHYIQQVLCSMAESGKENSTQEWGTVISMDGFSLFQLTSYAAVDMLMRLTAAWTPIFPKASYGIAVECSWYARGLFNLLSPVLGDSFAKLRMYGSKDDWMPDVLRHVGRDQIPRKFGGYENYTCRTSFCNMYENKL